jgi:hypothetical protein
MGSVTWNAKRDTGLVGNGLTHEKATRTSITMMKTYRARLSNPANDPKRLTLFMCPVATSSLRAGPKQDLTQAQHRASGRQGRLEIAAHTH